MVIVRGGSLPGHGPSTPSHSAASAGASCHGELPKGPVRTIRRGSHAGFRWTWVIVHGGSLPGHGPSTPSHRAACAGRHGERPKGPVGAGGWKPCELHAGMDDCAGCGAVCPDTARQRSAIAPPARARAGTVSRRNGPVRTVWRGSHASIQAYPADDSMGMLLVHNTSAASACAGWHG